MSAQVSALPLNDTILRVEHLDAGYGAIQVLHDISFEVRSGEILAVIGSNGAGKSTLFRAISGLITPSRGAIWMDGVNLVGAGPSDIVAHGIGQAPEGRHVFKGMTVEENLRLGAFRRRDKSRAVVAAALEQVYQYFPKLRDRRRQLAGTLSGGEQQMCAIGRALMAAPRVLVIDELSLGLAPIIVQELLHILDAINQTGTTVILVEQDISIALNFSDRALVMQAGQLVMRGVSSDLLSDTQIMKTYLGG